MNGRNLGVLFTDVGDSQPPALIAADADRPARVLGYAQLNRQADAIGRALLARGFLPGAKVAILALNSGEYVAALLGILRAGLVAVPINIKLPVGAIEHILRDSGARFLFGDDEQLARIASPPPHVSFSDDGLEAFYDWGPLTPWQARPDDVALLLYTSGSSGVPKGVVLSHDSHLWVVQTRLAARELHNERVLIAAPFYHMNALALILLSLASRVTAVILPQFSAPAYIRAIHRYRCSWLTAVPPMIAMMLREKALLAQSDLSCVRVVRMGSAPVGDSLISQINQLLPQARIINAYGTTEGGPVVFGPHPQGRPLPPLATGYPHPQVQLRLRAQDGQLSQCGVLELKSPALMLGYHQRPDIPSPFTPDGYYITGDVFRQDDAGFFTFIGRHDDMFVCGGENIYPSEVEQLLERHPAVQQACVVPVADEIKGEKPVAWVVLRAGQQTDSETLKAFTLQQGAAYLHPRHIWLVDRLPLAGTNKIDRNALKDEAARRITSAGLTGGGERPGIALDLP
ncbi:MULTISPECIES: class I adenylate-forming enzyme family protein [unclassified Brenneria]|uniref:class I adenylate-forming enzyme family protein n=1 Tax=unclassified Brenneria TaxID=2634434 RepID=UPI001556C2C8|nr:MULTISPECIES: class I adenylate-forming enzyme family protein [unclassified Brenneria]MBJ7221237.1 acyl--CoA ligase [Brenneria sp. L3-3C-1]MEE3642480.1 class I adenylate-forming enzyme family protein [Brenneria sp. L3_3C_1]MEE3650156.1 class I adenylate-forming enzyme family protein [Brenneria sp. HEZEL_4_2_4]NPD00114.1 acyl--CoA ligase [Brenneria sp. hezel4-2-4]